MSKENEFNNFMEYFNIFRSINAHLHYLRREKRGELNSKLFDTDPTAEELHGNDNYIRLLIGNFLIKDKHSCTICKFIYDNVDDYFKRLPIIFTEKHKNNINITFICDECRNEYLQVLLKGE